MCKLRKCDAKYFAFYTSPSGVDLLHFRIIGKMCDVDVDDVDVDVDVENRRAQAYASMPASYICELNLLILMLISNTKFGFRFQELWL